jgi:catechol 2,3-dioxygenase-like lactoylglutathione lyase family enzyme
MLAETDVNVILAVKDLEAAKQFYGEVLGLKEKPDAEPGGVTYKSGNTHIYVYESQYAGTNKATAAGWSVKDIEATVKELAAKGVTFEHYPEMSATPLEGDIHDMGDGFKMAWFKDPSGNILVIDSNGA